MTRFPPWASPPPRHQITPAAWLTVVAVLVIFAALCSCAPAQRRGDLDSPPAGRTTSLPAEGRETGNLVRECASGRGSDDGQRVGTAVLKAPAAAPGCALGGNLLSSLDALHARLITGRLIVARWQAARHVEEVAKLHHRRGPSRGTPR